MNDVKIDEAKLQLMQVNDPTSMLAGGIDLDLELHKLARNLKVLTKLKCLVGFDIVSTEHSYNRATMEQAKSLSAENLAEYGVVKSDKFKFIKTMLADEYSIVEKKRIEYRYFTDLMDTYKEWIMIYKKTRTFEE